MNYKKKLPSSTTSDLTCMFTALCRFYRNGRERNSSPLQCSSLENPRDGGAWWATIYGVTQSWTGLKRLRSSRSHSLGMNAPGSPLNLKTLSKTS